MQLLFRQRFFSWFDSYDIFDQEGNTVFTVRGQLDWGHRLEIYDKLENHLGTVKEEVFTFLPRFILYEKDQPIGVIQKHFSLFRPTFSLDVRGWKVHGDCLAWDYQVWDPAGNLIMTASKQLFQWTDTYVLDISNPQDALLCLMIVLAIDAAKCSSGS